MAESDRALHALAQQVPFSAGESGQAIPGAVAHDGFGLQLQFEQKVPLSQVEPHDPQFALSSLTSAHVPPQQSPWKLEFAAEPQTWPSDSPLHEVGAQRPELTHTSPAGQSLFWEQ